MGKEKRGGRKEEETKKGVDDTFVGGDISQDR